MDLIVWMRDHGHTRASVQTLIDEVVFDSEKEKSDVVHCFNVVTGWRNPDFTLKVESLEDIKAELLNALKSEHPADRIDSILVWMRDHGFKKEDSILVLDELRQQMGTEGRENEEDCFISWLDIVNGYCHAKDKIWSVQPISL